jgi:hypothetical protein
LLVALSIAEYTGDVNSRGKETPTVADHAMDATRYALHGELGEAARTEAYLAAMQRRLAGMWQG